MLIYSKSIDGYGQIISFIIVGIIKNLFFNEEI